MNLKITAPDKLTARVKLPPSKSISNRMLVLRHLSGNLIEVSNVSDCDDTFVMQRALAQPSEVTDIMAAGTSMRFLTAMFACSNHTTIMTGTERMQHRPIHVLVDALRSLGADIAYTGEEGFPPLKVMGRQLKGGSISLPGNVSSQYISALLMVAPTMEQGLTLHITGQVISRPYIDITLSLMRQFGIQIDEPDDHTLIVKHGNYQGGSYLIENDWSGASYWYEMLALAPEGEVLLEGLFANSLQGDSCISRLFEPLGIKTTFTPEGALLTKQNTTLSRYEADLTTCPDLAQTMVATCCAMGVPFRFSGLQSLKIKETDRLLALRQELAKLGFQLQESDSSTLSWDGQRANQTAEPPQIDTYEDHRMAMCMAPCCAIASGLIIRNSQVVSKSYPAFWQDLAAAGFTVEQA